MTLNQTESISALRQMLHAFAEGENDFIWSEKVLNFLRSSDSCPQ